MGCDMHGHYECLIENEWHHLALCQPDRDYEMFTTLADVRNDGVGPGNEPKGFPVDTSEVTKRNNLYWGLDGHSHSWMSIDELRELELDDDQHENLGLKYSQINYGSSEKSYYPSEIMYQLYKEYISDVRLVFWFDN